MRILYKDSDEYKIKLAFYQKLYKEEIEKQKQAYNNEYRMEYENLK